MIYEIRTWIYISLLCVFSLSFLSARFFSSMAEWVLAVIFTEKNPARIDKKGSTNDRRKKTKTHTHTLKHLQKKKINCTCDKVPTINTVERKRESTETSQSHSMLDTLRRRRRRRRHYCPQCEILKVYQTHSVMMTMPYRIIFSFVDSYTQSAATHIEMDEGKRGQWWESENITIVSPIIHLQ